MSDPKTPAEVENAASEAEEQTANPFAVEDEADLEGSLENIDLDEEAVDDEKDEADEGEEDEDPEGDEDEDLEDDEEYDDDGNPVEKDE